MFQRKPNRPPFQPGQNPPPNRPPNMQRPPHIPPPQQRHQNMPYRGNQQPNQYQNFDENRNQTRRYSRDQGNLDENQGPNRGHFNQGINRNQSFRNQYQNQNPYQDIPYNQPSQQQFREPRQYQKQEDQQDMINQRRNPQFERQPYNRNQQREEFIPPPPPRNPRNQKNEYQNKNDQDVMKNAMNQFFEQEFQSTQGRGRGRGRGGRGRPKSYERGENQHQRPFKSEMDRAQKKERFQKFKPKPMVQRETSKKNFIKKDEEQISKEISIESQRSFSEDEFSDDDEGSRSRSYSDESGDEISYSEGDKSVEDEGEYSDEGDEEEVSEEGEEDKDQRAEEHDAPVKLPSIKSMNDISTNAINDMCSKEEFNERLETFEQNNRDAEHSKLKLDTSRSFSIFEINRRTLKPEYALALNRFKRSAKREDGEDEDDTKDCRRSVKALMKVMNHINKEIIDADNMRTKDLAFPLPPGQEAFEFIHIYDFLWDRMREMIKDITRLSQKQQLTKEIITICEQIARFFILSINEGRKKYNSKLKFDERMNIESIIKVISNLMEVYRESRMNLKSLIQSLSDTEKENLTIEKVEALMQLHGIYISPHEPELSAYSFLFSDDRKKEFYRILTAGFEDPQTQSESPLINSDEMQRALAFHRTLNERNSEKYFDQIENPQTDYVFSCLMLKHLQMMRKETSKMLFKSHYYKDDMSETAQKSAILAETLKQTLRFPQSQSEQFIDFLDMLGVRSQGKLLIWRDGALNEDHYLIPQYIFHNEKTFRKNWSDEDCKKNITKPNKLSRQELIKCSWKKSAYREEIISFFLGKALQAKPIKPKGKISKEIPTKLVSKQLIEVPKEKEGEKEVQDVGASQKQKQAKNLLTLNQMRKGLQKKAKRTKFLQKIETQIHELFKHTDQAKIINRKKALAIMDEWLMYYHDKMLRLSFNMMENEARKKNLLANILREMKTYSVINKQFYDAYNKLPYEFEGVNQKNIVPQKTEKGLMSSILSKAHFRAKKVSHDSFEDYLNKTSHSFTNMTLNFMILTTCSSTSQNQKTLYDLMLYFIHQQKGNFAFKKKQLNQAISRNMTKEKQVPLLKVCFEAQNVTLNLRLAKINEAKSKRKAMTENSHVIQHLFGCHGLILMRDNSKHVATQVILQNLEEFVSSRSRIYQDEEKDKIQTLQKIDLPILLINSIKRPLGPQNHKGMTLSKISRQKYLYLTNLNQAIVIEGTTDPCNLPFMLRQQIQKQLKNTQDYMQTMNLINVGTHHFYPTFDSDLVQEQAMAQPFETSLQIRPLRELLREIRVNSSVIEEKLGLKEEDIFGEMKKKFIFTFYQEYFNLCLQQITQQSSECYKNSIFFKKWAKNLLLSQNILTQSSFLKPNLHSQNLQKLSQQQEEDLISQTLESQPEYNLITETFKDYEFLMDICQELKMKFVGEHIEPIDANYLIFDEDGFNVFGVPRKTTKDQTPRKEKQRVLHLTHFINTIGKYISLFEPNKTLSDEKFQNLYTIFQEYQLQFKIFNLNNLKYDSTQNQQNKELQINYQIEGDSLEFFSYIIGYLMEGCRHVNVLLPANFRFKISVEEFMHQGMSNLTNVINIMNFKKKDIFQNLRHEKIQSLSRLVLDDCNNQDGWGFQTTKDTNNGYNQVDHLRYGEYHEFDDMNEDDSEIPINVDREEESNVKNRLNPYKRDIGYHYRTVYSKLREEFPNPRREFLNQLRKQIKNDYQ